MRFIKKFESFRESVTLAEPKTQPGTSPSPKTRPGTRPTPRPNRPSPIRRDRPAVEPAPKAEAKLKKATIENVIEKFAKLTKQDI